MLADAKAAELGEAFLAQWLSTRLLGGRIRLDPIDNPWCTDSLMTAMRNETTMFFRTAAKCRWGECGNSGL